MYRSGRRASPGSGADQTKKGFFELADGTVVFVEPGTLRIAYVLTA